VCECERSEKRLLKIDESRLQVWGEITSPSFMRPLLALAMGHTIVALDNGLGLTPAMGYNTVRTETERATQH
jgi:hypothetical protein